MQDDVTLPTVIINDGRVLHDNLKAAGRDENWLKKQLKQEKLTDPKQVFLLTVDEQGSTVFVKKEAAQ